MIAAMAREVSMRRLGCILVALAVPAGGAGAQGLPGDPVAGAEIARGTCAACHVVADDQPIDPGIGPSFFEIAEHPATTALSLRAFLQTPHATMPNVMLTPEETDDLIAYVLSLKGG
jgi:mono/diheme cytochrome c family protein